MPLNACSINTYTTNTICSTKRAKYIAVLFGTQPPVIAKKGHPGLTGYYPDYRGTEDQVPYNLEQSTFQIAISINGETYSETYDNLPDNFMPFISINKLSGQYSEISVTANLRESDHGI